MLLIVLIRIHLFIIWKHFGTLFINVDRINLSELIGFEHQDSIQFIEIHDVNHFLTLLSKETNVLANFEFSSLNQKLHEHRRENYGHYDQK